MAHHLRGAVAVAFLAASASTALDGQVPATGAPPAWTDPSPHRVRHIPVAPDVQIEVLDWGGRGPALVFLTGLGMTAHVFDDFAPRFRDRYHVYAITRRGFGASSAPTDGYDAATRAHDIVTVLDSLAIDRAVLAGHSIAGDELSTVGTTYPERVRALVFLEAYDYGLANAAVKAFPELPPPPAMRSADSASAASVRAYGHRAFGAFLPESEVRAQMIFAPDGRLVGDRPNAAGKVADGCVAAEFRRITAPALAIFAVRRSVATLFTDYATRDVADRAAMDKFFSVFAAWQTTQIDRFRGEVRRSKVLEFRDADHVIYQSHPDQVERAMRDFLATAS